VVGFAGAPQLAPGLPRGWDETLGMAAPFGFFDYATDDLTNLATLKGWPLGLSLVDMARGAAVGTASAAGSKAALDRATQA
jgi:uncharacterized membrane protein